MKIHDESSLVAPNYTSSETYGFNGLTANQRHVIFYRKGKEFRFSILFAPKSTNDLIKILDAGYHIYLIKVDLSKQSILTVNKFHRDKNSIQSYMGESIGQLLQGMLPQIDQILIGQKVGKIEEEDLTCPKCKGYGKIDIYGHIELGLCFKCGGTGVIEKHSQREQI